MSPREIQALIETLTKYQKAYAEKNNWATKLLQAAHGVCEQLPHSVVVESKCGDVLFGEFHGVCVKESVVWVPAYNLDIQEQMQVIDCLPDGLNKLIELVKADL